VSKKKKKKRKKLLFYSTFYSDPSIEKAMQKTLEISTLI